MNSLPTSFRGTVVHGDKRGRLLGVPTANINAGIPDLAFGVYVSETSLLGEDTVWRSVTSYGTRPTFEGGDQRIETHILDFQRDIYGREIEIRLLAFVRPEQKFTSVNELIATMQQDLCQARAYCSDTASR